MLQNSFYNYSFKDNRLLYDKEKESGWEKAQDAVGTAAGAVAGVAESAAGLISKTIDYLQVGGVKAADLMTRLGEKWIDPKKPDFASDIYKKDFIDIWPGVIPSDYKSDLQYVINAQARIAYIKYKLEELMDFNSHANDALSKAEILRERIQDKNWEIKRSKIIAKSDYDKIEALIVIKKDSLRKQDRRSIEYGVLTQEISGLEARKKALDRVTSDEVLWDEPSIVKIEMPLGSGEYLERLVFDPSKKIKIDINTLYKYVDDYIKDTVTPTEESVSRVVSIEDYEEELKKLAFHRDIYHAKLDSNDKLVFTVWETTIGEQFDKGLGLTKARIESDTLTGAKIRPELLDFREPLSKKALPNYGCPPNVFDNLPN
ncbi:MAG: hypothetical protein AAB373_05255 [Patescibacteria group bacterium]